MRWRSCSTNITVAKILFSAFLSDCNNDQIAQMAPLYGSPKYYDTTSAAVADPLIAPPCERDRRWPEKNKRLRGIYSPLILALPPLLLPPLQFGHTRLGPSSHAACSTQHKKVQNNGSGLFSFCRAVWLSVSPGRPSCRGARTHRQVAAIQTGTPSFRLLGAMHAKGR